MKNRRAKLAAGATVLGLGALGGIALGTNPRVPAATQQAAGGAARIVTSTSGATTAVSQPVALRAGAGTRAPIVTGASGAGSSALRESDD
jgi:hypothetical protein